MQLQEEERREQQQRQQQQQRIQSRPELARGSPSRSNIPPHPQQQSSNSNQQRAESVLVRKFVYKKNTIFTGCQVCCQVQCVYGIFCQVHHTCISPCTCNLRQIFVFFCLIVFVLLFVCLFFFVFFFEKADSCY